MDDHELELSPREMSRESGNCWAIRIGDRFIPGDDSDNPAASTLKLFEDGRPLGPPHSMHDAIRNSGGGAFSHWGRFLMFSTSDNSNPTESGRRYTVRGLQIHLGPTYAVSSEPTIQLPCPACGATNATRPYGTRLTVDGLRTTLVTCGHCSALLNATALSAARDNPGGSDDLQETASRVFYGLDDAIRQLPSRLDAHRGLVKWYMSAAHETRTGRAVDLGAGLGFMAAAACDVFDEVWALELNRYTLDRMAPEFGLGQKLRVGSSLAEVPEPADAIFAWHTLEHIPELHQVGREIFDKLTPGGYFFWQVPMYADPYVVPSHYTFMNEYAAGVFCRTLGFSVEAIWHDEPNQFLTCLARKPVTA